MTESDKNRTESVLVDRESVVQIRHSTYLLKHHEFLKLTKIPSFLAIWAHSFFAGTGVFLFTVLARWLDQHYFEGSSSIANWEWILLIILMILVAILEGLVKWLPSEKKRTAAKIEAFYIGEGD